MSSYLFHSISAALGAYIDSKDGHPVHEMDTHMADDLVCRHVIDVWKHAVEYMQQQQVRAGGAHQ